MEIMYYEPEHLEICQELFTSIYNTEDFGCEFTRARATTYLEELTSAPRFIGFLLFGKQKLLGVALCHEKTWDQRDELYIDEFLIHPDHQQNGLGSKLLRFIEKFAKTRKLAGITLTTNALPLANFYIKNDFLEHDISFLYKGLTDENAAS